MPMIAVIALGGAVGAVARYLLGGVVQRLSASGFPAGTLFVNVSGSFLVGVLLRYFMNLQTHPLLRGAVIIGFCGGYTTFSAFSAETLGLVQAGSYLRAIFYILTSVGLSLAGVFAGFAAGSVLASD